MKRIIGGAVSRNNLAPIKYTWAWDAAQAAIANFWVPGEISMGDDRMQWETGRLTANEKHTFMSVFSTLTTSDILVQRNIALAVMAQVTAPEVEIALAMQVQQEAVHSLAYLHILENLGLDADEVYTLYERVPAIRQKFELADEYTKLIMDGDIRNLLLGLTFYYACFEGVWFYHGFTPIFAMNRKSPPLMKCSGEQLQYIMRDESGHTQFGIALINAISDETGVRLSQEDISTVFKAAYIAEGRYATYAIRPYTGYSVDTHMQHMKFLLDRRARQLQRGAVFGADSAVSWLDEIAIMKKEKNFFETRVTEYQKTTLSWDD